MYERKFIINQKNIDVLIFQNSQQQLPVPLIIIFLSIKYAKFVFRYLDIFPTVDTT